jgi:hypothetical protein
MGEGRGALKWLPQPSEESARSSRPDGGTPFLQLHHALVHQVSDWGSGVAIKMGRRQGATKEHIWPVRRMDRYVTEEQRSRRPIFIATLRAARLLPGRFVAHRSKTTAGILLLRFAHPVKIRSSATTPVTDLVH